MSPCTRFEDDALLQFERDEALDEHFASCPDCSEARAAYDRMRRELAVGAASLIPAEGWQERVRARIAAQRKQHTASVVWAATGFAAATILVFFLWPARAPPTLKLTATVANGSGQAQRGILARPGDNLVLNGTIDQYPLAELRVYRNDHSVVLRCSDVAPCRRSGMHLEAILTLQARGAYQSILLSSEHPLPTPGGDLDQDVGAALNSGAHVALGPEITVK